ncbi:restriction endonuclease [Paenibacillus tianmuensis]|nr:restriction endonuclease [Paenibacillus tianmuensis]
MQEEEFLQGFIGLAGIGSFFVTYYFTKSLSLSTTVAISIIAIVIIVMVVNHNKKVERLKKSGIADIDKMDGVQFEKYLGHLFRSQGYDVTVTKATGDYGADLIIKKNVRKIVIQAKRYSKNVGIKAVQEAQASIAHYGASEAWVVSNSDYTEAACELAKSNQVRLINRESLIEMILQMNPNAAPTPKQVIEQLSTDNMICSRCGNKMVLRKGPKGEFYGCSSFPKCRNTSAV